MSKRKTKQEFIKQARSVHNNKYNYSKVDYLNNKTKVTIICKEHGDFLSLPRDHIYKNSGCPTCGRISLQKKQSINLEEFIERAEKIHNNKYNYSQIKNIHNNKTKINYICEKHGKVKQEVSLHLNGRGCPECGKELNTKSRTKKINDFIQEANKIHNNKYDYSKVNYINSKIKIICKMHGKFKQNPHEHLSGQGCSICNDSKGEREIKLWLDKNNIDYIRQKTFDKCRNPKTNFKLRFDFYLPTYNLLIEFDGIQHFKPYNFTSNNDNNIDNFKKLKYRDAIKNIFCEKYYYDLLRIPYHKKDVEKILYNNLLKVV